MTKSKAAADLAKQIAQRLKEIRKASGLTQMQLAKKLKLTQPRIAHMESGDILPRIDRLRRYANACGYTLVFTLTPVDK